MSKLFDGDSDCEFDVKTNNEYAKNYDNWRKKEEINKLKTKYGEENIDFSLDNDSSSSSEDDEDGVELTEEVEKDFFKTLACLKKKDPRIYDGNVNFFNEKQASPKKEKKKKEQPMFIKDYERKLILEKGGQLSDSEQEDDDPRSKSPTYVEEQKKLKENLKNALNNIEDENDESWGGLFKERKKTQEEKAKEEAEYKEWLIGQKETLEDKNIESDLKPLKDFWNNPKLDKGEQFLRDYILNKKYLDKEDENYIPTYDEIIHDSDASLSDDAEEIERQEEFEHKFNFRFEEPDQEFIKRYPRTMEHSLRQKDDKRKLKRAEVKERKKKEKEEKMQDLKKLRELKRKEIEEKLEKLKEISGNDDIGFQDEDIDGDFDPEAHDRRMQALFNNEFYEGPEEDQKPEFPDIDEELEIERWDKYGEAEVDAETQYEPHCEDENFNMDCDYNPDQSTQEELIENSKGKKKRKRKSKFAQAVSKPKPKFDPTDKTYEKYFDEYYKLDCEDFIGDIPCRFKYREVVPNDFGLSVEEILMAKDRELNKWCSLKKAVQIRPDHVEKYDQIAFAKKGQNINLKRKLLPSLFEEDKEINDDTNGHLQQVVDASNTSKKKKKIKNSENQENKTKEEESNAKTNKEEDSEISNKMLKDDQTDAEKMSDVLVKKKKKGKKDLSSCESTNVSQNETNGDINTDIVSKSNENENENVSDMVKTDSKKKKNNNNSTEPNTTNKQKNNKRKRKLSENKLNNKKRKTDVEVGISDARLKAFGIKPKKFKNKLKYGNKQ